MTSATRAVIAVLAVVLVAAPAAAHVPTFPDDNTSPDRAVAVPDAVKSWSFYDRLEPGQVRYYRFSLDAGQRLRVGTFTPAGGRFTPSVVLLSPALNGTDAVPPGVTVPEGMGAEVVAGERPDGPAYEPFAPSANYHTVGIDRAVETDRTYLVAVYELANRSGPVGVAVGSAERFSPVEYATVPFDLVRTHTWAGQHPLVAVGPWLLTVLAGLALFRRRLARRAPDVAPVAVRYATGAAGLLVVASAAKTLLQMGIALAATGPTPGALVTAVFVVVPAVCGGWTIGVALRRPIAFSPRTRAGLAVAGVVALATWAGFLVGPGLLLALAVLPGRLVER